MYYLNILVLTVVISYHNYSVNCFININQKINNNFIKYHDYKDKLLNYKFTAYQNRNILKLYELTNELISHDADSQQFQSSEYSYYLLESKDLPEASELTTICFYRPRLNLNTGDMYGWEKSLWLYILKLYNRFDRFDFFLSCYIGYKTRSFDRLDEPNLKLSSDSIILVVKENNNIRKEIIGLIEICLEVPNGKLAPAIKLPFNNLPVQSSEPYICNLCVNPIYRGRKISKILCQLAEYIIINYWKRSNIYLHVEKSNLIAQNLYNRLGYNVTLPSLTNWELKLNGMDNLIYYHKLLS